MKLFELAARSGRWAWAIRLADRLGFDLGEAVPLSDPTFLGLMAQALDPEAGLDPAAWVSAGDLLGREMGSEVTADPTSLAAAALALQVASAAGRAVAGLSGAAAEAALDRIWDRTAGLLGRSTPHVTADQARLIAQALGRLDPLPLAA